MTTQAEEEVIDLFGRLRDEQQTSVLQELMLRSWDKWCDLSRQGQGTARAAALQRGKDWDRMSDAEKEELIDEIVQEDRECGA